MRNNEKKLIFQKKNQINKKNLKKKFSKTDLDFSFPSSCQKIKETLTGSFLISYGNYPPQVRCYDLENLSLKFERHLDSTIQNFQIISKDWQKLLFLRTDRYLEFHTKGGFHYKTKILNQGIDLLFHPVNNIVYVLSSKNEIFRLDLKEGKFLNSLKNDSLYENTCSGKSPLVNTIAFGNSGGIINFWDPRITQKKILFFEGSNFLKKFKTKKKISSIRFNEKNEFECFVGFENGEVLLFDIRSKYPLVAKEMDNPSPIISIRISESGKKALISNRNQIKIWEKNSGKTTNFFDSKFEINHLCKVRNSGFIFLALQKPKIEGKLIEEMGNIPFWISNFGVNSQNFNLKSIDDVGKLEKIKKTFIT